MIKLELKIFNSFDLKIEEGKTIGIVGKVGSGKTSILDLICRIYDPIWWRYFYWR